MDRQENNAREVRDKLVTENLPLVRHITARFAREDTDMDDLFQEGCIGLIKALESYNPERGTKFSTYAVPFILGEIRSFLRRHGHMFKVSRSFHEHRKQLHETIAVLEQKLERKPYIEELVEMLHIPKEEIVWLLDFQYPLISLNEKEYAGEEDFVTEDYLQRLMLIEKINNLPQRERQVMVLRYFLEKTQEETAQMLGISQVHVSRLERKILQQIRVFFVNKNR
jgi:RNA polymerase sporulation-specific sigma factor